MQYQKLPGNQTIGLDTRCNHSGHSLIIGGFMQTRANQGIARVKLWSVVLIACHYIDLRDDGAEPSDSKDNRPI